MGSLVFHRDVVVDHCASSNMGGKPYPVGRFAHTLRVRLMREHLGIDVDAMYEDDLMAFEPVKPAYEQEEWYPDGEESSEQEDSAVHLKKKSGKTAAISLMHNVTDGLEQIVHGADDIEGKHVSSLLRTTAIKTTGADATAGDVSLNEERTTFTRGGEKQHGFTSSIVPTLEEKTVAEHRPPADQCDGVPIEDVIAEGPEPETGIVENGNAHNEPEEGRVNGQLYGAPVNAEPQYDKEPPHAPSTKSDASSEEEKAPGARSTIRKHLTAKLGTKIGSKAWTLPVPTPKVDPYGFEDPICDEFWKNVWVACAAHNVRLFFYSHFRLLAHTP